MQTFLFADLARFTAMTEARGDARAADTAAGFCPAVHEVVPDYGAEEVKTIGDSAVTTLDRGGGQVIDERRKRNTAGSSSGGSTARPNAGASSMTKALCCSYAGQSPAAWRS